MADVQELMNKMENLNKELSTILDEAKQGCINDQVEEGIAAPASVGEDDNECPKFSRKVKLCCTTVVNHFDVQTNRDGTLNNVKLIFDPTCLHAVVEEEDVDVCRGNCTLHAYVVRVIGSLPFAFSATGALVPTGDAARHSGIPSPSPIITCGDPVDICCQCCACVDNAICCFADEDEAKAKAEEINDALETDPCSIISGSDTVKAEILKCGKLPGCSVFCHPDGCKDETLVKFTATLEIPDKSDRSHVVL